jgi:hypothetical protein
VGMSVLIDFVGKREELKRINQFVDIKIQRNVHFIKNG